MRIKTKKCSKCKEVKDVSLFGKCSAHKDGLLYNCKACIKSKITYHTVVCDTCKRDFIVQSQTIKRQKKKGYKHCISCTRKLYIKLQGDAYVNSRYGVKMTEETKEKIRQTKHIIQSNGKTVAQNAAKKSAMTSKKTGAYQVAVAKATITKNKNDSWVMYKTAYFLGLKYQSSLEKRFIQENQGIGLQNCKKTIPYIHENKARNYLPDFYSEQKDMFYEIKCIYTWKAELEKNISKLIGTLLQGKHITLVIYKEIGSNEYGEALYFKVKSKKQLVNITNKLTKGGIKNGNESRKN